MVELTPEPLRLEDAWFAYDAVPAVAGLSTTIEPRAFVGVVGPNGSGKSTLVRLLSGYLRPQRGRVWLGERELQRLGDRERARRIAVVPQDPPAALDFTVLEVVLMGRAPHLALLGVENWQDLEVARAAMDRTRTGHLAARLLGTLSGGERQRVLLARALAQQTPILLLDEPTSHLDVNYQIEILRLLRELRAEQGTTVLAVLHDLNLASLYCDRLLLLSAGRLAAEGSPIEVLTAPRLAAVYGAPIWCEVHAVTGKPAILPLIRDEGSGT
jgi:iron complex transport system ATP-binding protein